MATWEGRTFTVTLSSLGEMDPANYEFQFAPMPEETVDTAYYQIVPASEEPTGHPFEGCGFLLQSGRKLTKYLPPDQRLDDTAAPADYQRDLQNLVDLIIGDKIEEDPCGYERLVGFVPNEDQPFNPVTFYQVEHTHQQDDKVLLIVRANFIGTSPNGSIIVIG